MDLPCVYICEILDGFMLIWNILYVGLSVFAKQAKYEISYTVM